ncbi:MAG: hypothetical protein HOQ01_05710 [Lysobacter sp.]|nr:hypothetical protein [Lysobacter sp.]
MRRIAWWTLLASLLSAAALAQDVRPKFESFEGEDPENRGSPVFVFSSASATAEDPIIITIRGRDATAADRQAHRTAIQRYWLAINVPEQWEGVQRVQVSCFHKRPREYPACDNYTFRDPKTGKEHDFYIYIGNWRMDEVEE